MNVGHEKTSVLAYNTLFEGSGIRHSNAGLQLTHDVHSRVFHAAVRSDTRPRRLGGHLATRPGQYDWNFGSISPFPKLSRVYCIYNMTIPSAKTNCALSIEF